MAAAKLGTPHRPVNSRRTYGNDSIDRKDRLSLAPHGRFGRLSLFWSGLAIAFSLFLGAPNVHAAGPWDPETDWRVLESAHFEVIHPAGYAAMGRRTVAVAEAVWPEMVRRYGFEPPGRISIILDDQTDFANGSARVLPNRIVTVYLTAPIRTSGLEEYDSWLETVLIHELAHIFHLDMSFGLAGIGRAVLGQYVQMNAYAAAWSTEGWAVLEETLSTGAGRGRSTYVDMVLRMAALEGRFPDVDQAYRAYPRWPFGNVAYFFGGRFQLWLVEMLGEDAVMNYHRAYAADPIPYLTYIPAKEHLGAAIETLWDGWAEDVLAESERVRDSVVETRPTSEPAPERLSFHGGQSVGPRVTPDGRSIIFSASSPVDGPRVRMMPIDGGGETILANDTLSQAVAVTPDGSAFYYQQTEINQRFYQHDQLLRYDFERGETARVKLARGFESFAAASGALRARDPDVSPDGTQLVFVQNHEAINRLVLADLSSDGLEIRPRVIVPGVLDVQLASPRFSPDGARIALARFRGGRRDIVIYDLEGRVVREVTRDRAQDIDPTWSPDGRWLVFPSDRGRVYDLYAYELSTGETRRLTHLVSGAFQPSISPDGDTLVFRGYTSEGFDVFRMPFRPESAPRASLPVEPELALDRRPRTYPPMRPAALDETALEEVEERGYSPWSTLLPSRSNWNLLPTLSLTEREALLGLGYIGQDALQTQYYSLQVRYGTFTQLFGGTATYVNDMLEPSFWISADARALTYARALYVDASSPAGCAYGGRAQTSAGQLVCFGSSGGLYVEQRLSASAGISLPVRQRHLFSLSYTYEDRSAAATLPEQTLTDFLPAAGRYARVSIGYSYANTRRFAYSVSAERGPAFSASLSALSKGLGGDYEQALVTLDGRYYWDLPWADNHVLAARLTAGLGGGPDLVEVFRLGGASGSSALSSVTESFYPLRGLAAAVLFGTGQISGTLEYRAPLFRVDRGLGTAPLTLSVVHAAAFVDAGRTFEDLGDFGEPGFVDGLVASAGVELRADILLAFVAPLTLRVGFAWPLALPASLERGTDTEELYFQLGSSF